MWGRLSPRTRIKLLMWVLCLLTMLSQLAALLSFPRLLLLLLAKGVSADKKHTTSYVLLSNDNAAEIAARRWFFLSTPTVFVLCVLVSEQH